MYASAIFNVILPWSKQEVDEIVMMFIEFSPWARSGIEFLAVGKLYFLWTKDLIFNLRTISKEEKIIKTLRCQIKADCLVDSYPSKSVKF